MHLKKRPHIEPGTDISGTVWGKENKKALGLQRNRGGEHWWFPATQPI